MGSLYITEQGAVITKTDGRLVVRKDGQMLEDLPALHVDQIVIFGNAGLTTPAIRFVLEKGIDVAYLSSRGTYRGRLQPEWAKDATVRQQQYHCSLDPRFCLLLAQQLVIGKLRNAMVFGRRQRRLTTEARQCLTAIDALLPKVTAATHLDQVRGYEGAGAASYYRVFRTFLQDDYGFRNRQAHPPTDPVNALLSLGYTLLYNHLYAAINVVGLDPYQGFFHQLQRGHAALASDLVEEWRAVIVDSVVLSLLNRREITRDDFRQAEQGLRLTKPALTRFLTRYDARISEEVFFPTLQVKTSYRRVFELQVRHLGKVILGEETTYQPFTLR